MQPGHSSRWRPSALDAVLALAFAVGSVVNLFYVASEGRLADGERAPDTLAYLLVVTQSLPIAWRRIAPVGVLTVTSAGFVFARMGSYPVGVELVGISVGLYAVALKLDRSRSAKVAWPFIIGLTGFTALGVILVPELDPVVIGFMAGSLLLPYLLGRDAHERRARSEAAELRAAEIERNQEALRDAAIRAERTRIARELHDVVAHKMTVMTIQAGAARRILDRDPDKAAHALEAIEEAGHDALVEMRRMLGVLRTDEDAEEAAPQPGLSQLDDLTEQMREAGLDVDVTTTGSVRPLSPGIDLNAFRIIQESLTNALKHGGPRTVASVEVDYGSDELTIRIRDNGPGGRPSGPDGSGQGLLGMKERAALLRGSLTAGPRISGGFHVTTKLPLSTP